MTATKHWSTAALTAVATAALIWVLATMQTGSAWLFTLLAAALSGSVFVLQRGRLRTVGAGLLGACALTGLLVVAQFE